MKWIVFFLIPGLLLTRVSAQEVSIKIKQETARDTISRHIYGHFAEHLGRCIYDGFYVGDSSNIPNTRGVRNDIINALKELHIPNLRWPGGCFADTYHWMDAIGPKGDRKPIENMSWGNYREDNSFGTNEFLDLCELLGAEPYLAVNMNSGTVQEAVEWVQYTNHANGTSYMTDLREKYGRDKPWKVKFWGIGNESWDCGGNMTANYYTDLYKRYATAMTSYANAEGLFRIAVGPGWDDYNWTETVMKNIPAKRFEGLSIHHYSVIDWNNKGSSYDFNGDEYFKTMKRAWFMDEFVTRNSEVMDKYDPDKKIALVVDEWGGWYETMPSGKGALYQQNTIRDAMIAGLTLNIFNNHADRVKMANLAQTVNVLQAVILTEGEKMILTPTYHVMNMYKVHQDALLLPTEIANTAYGNGKDELPALSVSASKDRSGKIHISIVNINPDKEYSVFVDLNNVKYKSVNARVLASENIQDHNTFDDPDKVRPKVFKKFKLKKNGLEFTIPKAAVLVFELD